MIGAALVRRRKAVLIAVLVGAAVFACGLKDLGLGFKVDGFFRSSVPELQRAMEHYAEDGYEPPDRLLLFAWAEDDPVSPGALEQIMSKAAKQA